MSTRLSALLAATVVATAIGAGAPASAGPAAQSRLVPAACATAGPGHAHCNAIQLVPAASGYSSSEPGAVPAAPTGYGPADIRSAYHLGTDPGSGQVVAIVDAYDDPKAEADLGTYRSQYGLAACTTANGCFRKVNQNGGSAYPAGDPGWGAEITLDLDAVSATCPGCHILLVETNTNDDLSLAAGVDEAVSLGAKFVSNSYSDAESEAPPGINAHYNHPGVMIAAATGDNGSVSGTGTQYPASSPTVVAIGGTSLGRSGNPRGWSETAWGSTGSGCSATYAKPAYQQGLATGCANRATSDVSAVANPNTGLAVYDSYGQSGWLEYGGTSLSTPIISAIWALAGAPAGGANAVTYPYAHAGSLNDVTSGSNGSCGAPICQAGTGWDGPTGLGTPNGTAAFVAGTTGANDFSVTLSPTSAGIAAGGSATTTVSTALTSGTVGSVTLSATGLPSGATASLRPGSVTAGSPATLTVSTTSSVAAGTYPISVIGSAASTSHQATFTLTVTAPGGGGTVILTNPGNQFGYRNLFGATVQMKATDSAGQSLFFSATGLPPGVTITSSGRISGVPTRGGTYPVRVNAADAGGGSGGTSFSYQVYGF